MKIQRNRPKSLSLIRKEIKCPKKSLSSRQVSTLSQTGHADLIDRICNLGIFDELVVAIGVNPAKPARFTLEERTEMLQTVIEPYPQATIDGYTGLTGHYAQTRGACVIVRGLREVSDLNGNLKWHG